jgi:AcrR family transcriptional regulator
VETRTSFQRARRPEQVRERREAILAAARELLARRRAADVSLRELADAVGLAMSNVLRYFDSREAIFAQILDAEWRDWLDELAVALPAAAAGDLPVAAAEEAPTAASGELPAAAAEELSAAAGEQLPAAGAQEAPSGGFARPLRVVTAITDTLLARPLLCELLSAIATILERNIPLDFTREFKRQSWAHRERLGGLVREQFPSLRREDGWDFAGTVVFTLAGLWPYTRPTGAVATVLAEAGMPPARDSIDASLREILVRQLVGTLALAERER